MLIFCINLNAGDCISICVSWNRSNMSCSSRSKRDCNICHCHPNKHLYSVGSGMIRFIDILFKIVREIVCVFIICFHLLNHLYAANSRKMSHIYDTVDS